MVGLMGALPTEHIVMLDRSASSKHAAPTSSSTIAGTRNTAPGRRSSTTPNQRSASNRGRYSRRMPSFIGL